jgi:hypothetical protein
MPSASGLALAKSGLLQPIGPETADQVTVWVTEQLKSADTAVRLDLDARMRAWADAEDACCLVALAGRPCEHAIGHVAKTLLREHYEDLRGFIAPSSSSLTEHEGFQPSMVPFAGFHRAIRIALASAKSVVQDAPRSPGEDWESRDGSTRFHSWIIDALHAEQTRLLAGMNAALTASFSTEPYRVSVLGFAEALDGRPAHQHSFADVWLRLRFDFDDHGVAEVRDVPVNIKSVRDLTAPTNTGGANMLAWIMFGDHAPKVLSRSRKTRHALSVGINAALHGTGADRASLLGTDDDEALAETDYVFWIWPKPDAGAPLEDPFTVPMLAIDPEELAYNPQQSWPGIQLLPQRADESARSEVPTSALAARRRLWSWIQQHLRREIVELFVTVGPGDVAHGAALPAENLDEMIAFFEGIGLRVHPDDVARMRG